MITAYIKNNLLVGFINNGVGGTPAVAFDFTVEVTETEVQELFLGKKAELDEEGNLIMIDTPQYDYNSNNQKTTPIGFGTERYYQQNIEEISTTGVATVVNEIETEQLPFGKYEIMGVFFGRCSNTGSDMKWYITVEDVETGEEVNILDNNSSIVKEAKESGSDQREGFFIRGEYEGSGILRIKLNLERTGSRGTAYCSYSNLSLLRIE